MSTADRNICSSSASWAPCSSPRWSTSDCPTVGILNIGEEEIKGNEVVKAAAELLRASGLNFIGNVEGDGIYKGDADVVVCDGFVGNVALKASEGLAQMLGSSLRGEFKRNWLTKLAAVIAMSVLNNFKQRFRPSPLQRGHPAGPARHFGQEPRIGRRVCLWLRHRPCLRRGRESRSRADRRTHRASG
jgi:hypothetical protein